MNKTLTDSHKRTLTKLRLNLLDACNMRCLYCMPQNQKFKPLNKQLTPNEMKAIVSNLQEFGIEEVRLTGGEPLLHPHFQEIVKSISTLNLKKLALTTNAILLHKHLPLLKELGVSHINISLDSLCPKTFEYVTKTDKHKIVIENIIRAKKLGFKVKINTVLLKNINFEEIEDFLQFSISSDIEVRFLELMKIGHALQYFERHFVSADEAINKLKPNWKLASVSMPKDSTSFNFLASNERGLAKIGFIASESRPFCSGCSRLRISSEGVLRPCLMINEGPNIKDSSIEKLEATLNDLIEKKPFHRLESNALTMNKIGG